MLRLPTIFFSALVLCASVVSASSRADENSGALLIQWDNDKVVNTDRHYTNGMRIAYTANTPVGWIKDSGETLADIFGFTDHSALRAGWTLGQDMYTPEDVETYTPDPLDRPYAGWTYVGLTVQNDYLDTQDTMELDIGIVGPSSRAGHTQNAFHRLINSPLSHGWRSQIDDEVGLLATRTYKVRSNARSVYGSDWLQTDFIGHGTAQLGNVRTGAGVGATARLGENLAEDFGPIFGTFALPHKRPNKLTYSVFIGAETRAVARDIFLDGNTFQDSPSVDKNPFVIEVRTGFTVHVPLPDTWRIKAMRASINIVNRTREFKTQDKADHYGSAQITMNF
jgi:hypothetical protein